MARELTAGKPENPALDYWSEASRPLVSLAFVVPMLLIYEAGVLLLGPQATRNGVDVCLRHFLDMLGFGQYFLLPILTTSILLAWHHTTRQQWRFRFRVLYGMLLESLSFGFLLLLFAQLQGSLFAAVSAPQATLATLATGSDMGRLIGYFGAGIYEELAFRLMLLPSVAALLRIAGLSRRQCLIAAVVITSLLFSLAHYQIFASYGDVFQWFSFLFRFLAGLFFSLLFIWRGFGIAVGAHALYDIFVVLT